MGSEVTPMFRSYFQEGPAYQLVRFCREGWEELSDGGGRGEGHVQGWTACVARRRKKMWGNKEPSATHTHTLGANALCQCDRDPRCKEPSQVTRPRKSLYRMYSDVSRSAANATMSNASSRTDRKRRGRRHFFAFFF